MNKLATLALILTTLAALPVDIAHAKPRPTVDHGDGTDCFFDPDSDTNYDDGLIVSCCYDDGCWICEKNPGQNCVWDPKYRTMAPTGDLTVKPEGDRPSHTIKLKLMPKGLSVDGVSTLRPTN